VGPHRRLAQPHARGDLLAGVPVADRVQDLALAGRQEAVGGRRGTDEPTPQRPADREAGSKRDEAAVAHDWKYGAPLRARA